MCLNVTPLCYMNEQQAEDIKGRIFDQLHEFESVFYILSLVCLTFCLESRRLQSNAYASFVSIQETNINLSESIYVRSKNLSS